VRIFFIFHLFFLALSTVGAQTSMPLPPEHDRRRVEKLEIMLAPINRLPVNYSEVLPPQRPSDPTHLLEFVRDGDNDYTFTWIPRGPRGYDPTLAGTWIITFSRDLGRMKNVKIFLGSSPFSYMLLTPERSVYRAEVFLEGERIASRVPILMETSTLLTAPLSEIVAMTEKLVAWNIVFPDDGGQGRNSMEMAIQAGRILGRGFPEAPDGALDERGVWRKIATGDILRSPGFNCSGLTKWFTDAVFYAHARRFLPLDERLLEKPFEVRGNAYSHSLEDTRDPFFGLDWTRALAREVRRVEIGGEPNWTDGDVNDYPFVRYVPNRGYPLQKLAPIAAWLSVARPAKLFLLSVNGDFQPTPSDPVLLQHRHTAVLLVWSESGRTVSAVFETDGTAARQTSLDSLSVRFPDHYVHIVEVPLVPRFRFPALPLER